MKTRQPMLGSLGSYTAAEIMAGKFPPSQRFVTEEEYDEAVRELHYLRADRDSLRQKLAAMLQIGGE